MKKSNMYLQKIQSILFLFAVTFIPILLNAQGSSVGIYSTDLDGRFSLESIITDIPEYSDAIPEQMPGWPQSMLVPSYYAPSGVSLADVDEDGFLEIISACTDGSVHIWDYQGHELTGWPKTGLNVIQSKAAVGDIDPDYPGLEILIAGKLNRLYAWHNDGEIEICAVSYYSVFLWDKDGVAKPGWPKLNVAGGMSYAQPVFADLDDDGDLEIFGGCHGYGILERHHNGDTVAGWPVDIYNIECSPIIFDLDNDGEREIIFGDNAGSFYAYN